VSLPHFLDEKAGNAMVEVIVRIDRDARVSAV